VPNPRGMLLPGMYVRVRIEQAKAANAMLLPQQAVTRGSTGDTVMVVAQDGQVSPRTVKIGGAQNGQWVVLDGLKPGEQVMVDGFQKLRPGAPVKPVAWSAGGAPAAAASGSAPAASAAAAKASAAAAPPSAASAGKKG
jgi:membrane fusion protein, multidrug efflux system